METKQNKTTELEVQKTEGMAEFLNLPNVQNSLKKTLGENYQSFVTTVVSLYNSSEKMKECDQKSLMLACITATSLGLPVNQNLGFAYIIPYRDNANNRTVAQLQIGYKGFIQLALNSNQFKTINATDVREGEIVKMDRLTGEITFDFKDDREKLKVIGYAGYFKLINGFTKTLYMTVAELQAHGVKYSQTAKRGTGLWKDEFDLMAKKTVLKQLLSKYAPLSNEMQTAVLADQSHVKGEGDYDYLDNKILTPKDIADQKENDRIMLHIKNAPTIEDLKACEEYLFNDEQRTAYSKKEKELTNV